MDSGRLNSLLRKARSLPPSELAWDESAALQFALEFAQMDLAAAMEASSRLVEFVGGGVNQIDRETLLSIHKTTGGLLRDLACDGYAGYDLQLRGIISLSSDARRPSRKSVRVMTNVDAMSTPHRFLYRLIRLLEHVGGENVRECQAPQAGSGEPCGRIFLKVTRKEFCSPRCQSRAYMRGMRRREREEKERRVHRATTRRKR